MFDFKGLVNALFRRNGDDPVGNLKSATIWVQELTQNDMHEALDEILKALAKLNKNPNISLKERIRVLLYLDEKARSLQESLCQEFLAAIDDPLAPAQRNLPTILQFWQEMAAGYQICIRIFANKPGSGKILEQMPLLTAKATHFYAMQAKWAHIRYMPVEPKVWRGLHRLYLFAEREAFDRAPVHLYPQLEETTCASEYLQAMMLHLANPASLLPAQIAMVDTWLDSWAKSLVIESNFRPHRQLYTVNLGDMKPARKLRRNMLGEKYRYWGVGLMLVTISKVVEQLKQGELPVRLKLGEDCRLPGCFDLIEEVSKRWAGQNSTRKHERTPTSDKTLTVSQGLGNIISQLRNGKKAGFAATISAKDESSLNPPTRPMPSGEDDLFSSGAQEWQVEDESLSGYGVTFTRHGSRQLKIGTLVGLKAATTKTLAIGVVRRTINAAPRQIRAGIETLSQTPVLVEIHPLQNEKGRAANAVYLPELPKLQLGRSLLLPSELYVQGKLVQLKAQGKAYTIRLQPPVERGTDYIQAGFDVVAKG